MHPKLISELVIQSTIDLVIQTTFRIKMAGYLVSEGRIDLEIEVTIEVVIGGFEPKVDGSFRFLHGSSVLVRWSSVPWMGY